MKLAIVGTGYWGKNHVRIASELKEAEDIESVVLCDIDESQVSDLAENYRFPYRADYESLLTDGVDAAVIATPSPTHRDIATTLLEGGVDVLVEKPISLDSDSARVIVETAERFDRTMGVGHIFRYHPALNELKSRIDRGELGEIKYLNTTRFSFGVPRKTTGVLYSLAIHDVDIYGYLLDESLESIYCQLDRFVRDGIDETATIVGKYGSTTGVINASWQVPVYGKRRDIVVVGTNRTAYIDYLHDNELELFESKIETKGQYPDGEDVLVASDNGSNTHTSEAIEPLKFEMMDFIDACRTGSAPKASGRIGLEAVELLEYAEKSAATGQRISVN